ncbi:MAG: hypothetical protein V3V39_00170 [Desulfobacterales bacterium]
MKNEIKLVYTHFDRMIVGGVFPNESIRLGGTKEIGTDFFLERREMGIINVGPKGSVGVDGEEYTLDTKDGLYVGVGCAIGNVSIERVSRRLWPFWLSMFAILMLVTYFPIFSMWIPMLVR